MNVLIVGGGGREHALAWCIARSDQISKVFVAPGNAGTALEPKCTNVEISESDFESLAAFATQRDVNLTIVGPEAPLVDGLRDFFDSKKLLCFAPQAAAAQLEGSKVFAKQFMARHEIPTAPFFVVDSVSGASNYLKNHDFPIAVKADGLAAGKGVVIAHRYDEAMATLKSMIEDEKFGSAGRTVVLEDFLYGEEASFIVMTDGEHILPFATSQDHKAAYDGDSGPNTGGMGAYSPAPVVDESLTNRIMDSIIRPTIQGMRSEGMTYQGFLYAGLMISPSGDVNVVEFNCRFGDPEAQVVLTRLESDLAEMCVRGLQDGFQSASLSFRNDSALGIVMASGGYPGSYERNKAISGLDNVTEETKVFHAGTAIQDQEVVTNGGRVLCVTALGEDVTTAQQRAYDTVSQITWEDCYFRTDIGYRAVAREQADR